MKNKKVILKKVQFGLLALSLLVFVGCSQDTSGAEQSASEDSAVTSQKKVSQDGTEPAVPVVPSGERPNEIVISLEGEDAFINEAAEKYMADHNDVKISVVQIGSASDRDKYSQIVATELIGGNGADIYDARLLSYYKLADSNLLADLNEYMGDDLKDEKYAKTLFDAFLYDGKQYTVPLSYDFSGYEIDESVAEEYNLQLPAGNLDAEALIFLSEQLPSDGSVSLFAESGSGYMDGTSLSNILIENSFNDFVDFENKSANFEDEKFRDVINTVNVIVENGQLATETKKSLIKPFMLYSPTMSHAGTVDYKDMRLLTNENGQAAFSSTSFLPILNANSTQKEIAADFIKFLLSDEMQSAPSLLFNPVNKNAIEAVSRLSYEDLKSGGYLPDGFTEETLTGNIEKFSQLSDSLNIFVNKDRYINSLLWDELAAMFNDEGGFKSENSALEAADSLQSSVNLYLNE